MREHVLRDITRWMCRTMAGTLSSNMDKGACARSLTCIRREGKVKRLQLLGGALWQRHRHQMLEKQNRSLLLTARTIIYKLILPTNCHEALHSITLA